MSSPAPHIGLLHTEDVPPELFEDFIGAVSAKGLDLNVESRPPNGPFAGLEWLIPTGVMLFIGQGYFNGFLSEMGKDHYLVLKSGMKSLRDRFSSVKVTLIGTPGKVSGSQPYSLFYSIYFEGPAGRRSSSWCRTATLAMRRPRKRWTPLAIFWPQPMQGSWHLNN